MKQNNGEFTLRDFWHFMVSKMWVIIFAAILGGFVMYSYANSNNSVTYTVSTSFFVQSISSDGTTSNVSVSKQRVPLYMAIISSNNDYHEEILNNLTPEEREEYGFSKNDTGDLVSIKKMSSMIRTEQWEDLEMFYVYVTASTEECAMRISEVIEEISTEEDETKNAVYKNIGAPSHIRCVDNPRFVGISTSRNTSMSLLIGIFGGALLAVCALWIYSAFDNRIRTRRSLEMNFDLPVLGVVPSLSADSISNKVYFETARRVADEEL